MKQSDASVMYKIKIIKIILFGEKLMWQCRFMFAYSSYLLTVINPSPEAIACVYLYSFLEGSQSNR